MPTAGASFSMDLRTLDVTEELPKGLARGCLRNNFPELVEVGNPEKIP